MHAHAVVRTCVCRILTMYARMHTVRITHTCMHAFAHAFSRFAYAPIRWHTNSASSSESYSYQKHSFAPPASTFCSQALYALKISVSRKHFCSASKHTLALPQSTRNAQRHVLGTYTEPHRVALSSLCLTDVQQGCIEHRHSRSHAQTFLTHVYRLVPQTCREPHRVASSSLCLRDIQQGLC